MFNKKESYIRITKTNNIESNENRTTFHAHEKTYI
ncbi:hypothetical protein HDE68_002730 [Pedobacter cryoconitis]|uniref:Uncharacterized protein n=1 Tax=Pedobacter cryoconitis TaxID=188932 RepID=A0A7W9DZ23_9SPHI|nr:hypothetical protein [Pedobacter cryoconitis]